MWPTMSGFFLVSGDLLLSYRTDFHDHGVIWKGSLRSRKIDKKNCWGSNHWGGWGGFNFVFVCFYLLIQCYWQQLSCWSKSMGGANIWGVPLGGGAPPGGGAGQFFFFQNCSKVISNDPGGWGWPEVTPNWP